MKYLIPILLKENSVNVIDIGHGIKLSRISDDQLNKFFGIDNSTWVRDYVFANTRPDRVKYHHSPKVKGGSYSCDLTETFGLWNGTSDIFAANYVLEIESEERPDEVIFDVNLLFSIIRPTSTAGWLIFNDDRDDGVGFLKNQTISIAGYYDYLKGDELKEGELESLYNKLLEAKNEPNFKVARSLYQRSIGGGDISDIERFLLIVIALESLYLPGKSRQELSYKFRLRIAKLLDGKLEASRGDLYKKAKLIYDTRSFIVHSGDDSKLKPQVFHDAVIFTLLSLRLFLENKDLFNEINLEQLCLN